MEKDKSYFKNFVTMLSGNTLSQLIPFIIAPILTRIFSEEDFAVFANFMAIVGVIGIVSTGRLELAVPIPFKKEKAQNIVFTGLLFTAALTLLSILIPLNSSAVANFYNDNQLTPLLYLIPFGVASYGFLNLANSWNIRNKKFSSISVGKVSQSLVNNGLGALFGFWLWGIYGLVVAWLISQVVNILVLVFNINLRIERKRFSVLTVRSTLKKYRDFPLINSLHAFTDLFATQFLLFWLITSFFGNAELGLFSIMFKYVRAPIVLISSSVSQLFYVEASQSINAKQSVRPIMFRTLRTTILFAIPFVLVLFFFAPAIFNIYLGAKWEIAGVYAQCMLPVLFLTFLVSPISGLPILMNKQKTAFLLSVIGYTLSLGMLYLAVTLNYDFKHALYFYAAGFTVYYLILLTWYYNLAKQENVRSY